MQAKSCLSGVHTFNLGTGNGYSVLDMIKAFEQASGLSVPYQIKSRRPGDVPLVLPTLRLPISKPAGRHSTIYIK